MSRFVNKEMHDTQFAAAYEEGRVLKITSAEVEGASIGLNGVLFWEIQGNSIFFGPFAVRESCNGKGYGRALIDAMENIGRKKNLEFIEMHVVNWRTQLVSLYTYLGFETLEDTCPYLDVTRLTRPCHFIKMRREIKKQSKQVTS